VQRTAATQTPERTARGRTLGLGAIRGPAVRSQQSQHGSDHEQRSEALRELCGETDEIGEARESAEMKFGEQRADQQESWHDTKSTETLEQNLQNETFIEQESKTDRMVGTAS